MMYYCGLSHILLVTSHTVHVLGHSCYLVHEFLMTLPFFLSFFLLVGLQELFTSLGFPDSSVGKEFSCNAGDPGSIPRSGRSPGERIGYPLRYSWASFLAQLLKNPPAMQETWAQSLGWEEPLEKGKAIPSNILALRIPWAVQSMGSQSWTRLNDFGFSWWLSW